MSPERLIQLSGSYVLSLPEEDPEEFSPDLIDAVQIPEPTWPSLTFNWPHVRTHYRLDCKFQDTYVFRLSSRILTGLEVAENAQIALLRQHTQFRFNISFAFVLVRKATETSAFPEMRIFYASNNSGLYEQMIWCPTHADVKNAIDEIVMKDIYEELSERLPNTAWKIHSIISMTVYVGKMKEKLY